MGGGGEGWYTYASVCVCLGCVCVCGEGQRGNVIKGGQSYLTKKVIIKGRRGGGERISLTAVFTRLFQAENIICKSPVGVGLASQGRAGELV